MTGWSLPSFNVALPTNSKFEVDYIFFEFIQPISTGYRASVEARHLTYLLSPLTLDHSFEPQIKHNPRQIMARVSQISDIRAIPSCTSVAVDM